MPRNVRIALLAGAAAVVAAALAVAAAGTASARSTAGSINGAGSTFVQPLVTNWESPVQQQLGLTLNFNGVGSTAQQGQEPAGRVDHRRAPL